MKMMKNITVGLTLAFAALSASVTRAGDIYEIVPLGLSGTSQAGQQLYGTDWEGLTPDTALDAGQSFEFIVRLASSSVLAPTPTNSWDIAYTGVGSDIYADLYYPLQLGLLVSGRLVGAEIYDINRNAGLNGSMAFTDLYCRYTVKPGDIALPTLLAHDNSGATFFLINDDKWQVQDEQGRVAVFSYCDEPTRTAAAGKRPVGQYPAMCRTDSLADLNYHVKTIGFDENEDVSGTWWRVVNQGATTTTNAPTIELTGAVATTNAVELFMWAEDETAVKMVGASGGTLETMTIYPTPEATAAEARNVYRFWTVPGKTVYPVAFEGVMEGADTRLYLSTTTNFVHDAAGTVLTNFLTRAVYCTEPLPPSVKITLTDNVTVGATLTAKSGALEALGQTDALALKVRLTKPLASDEATVTLKVTIPGDPAADPFGGNYLSLAQTQDQAFSVRSETNIVFTAGGATEQIVYVWPLGGDAATAAGGVLIEPVFDAATTTADVSAYDTANGAFRLKLNDLKPVIVAPASADAAVVNDGKVTLDIEVDDCYRDLNAPQEFKVTFLDKTQTVAFRFGQTTSVTFDAPASSGNRTLTVTDPQGNVVSLANIYVNVKRVSAVVQGEAYETTVNEGNGQYLPVTVNLSVPYDGGDLYAFLEPADETASNLVTCAASVKSNIKIPSGMLSNGVASVLFDIADGYDVEGSPVTAPFDLVLRDGDTTNANVVAMYESTRYVFNLRNVAPSVSDAKIDGRSPKDGMSDPVPMGVATPIEVVLTDPSLVDFASTNKGEILRVRLAQTDVEGAGSDIDALNAEIDYIFSSGYGLVEKDATITTNAFGKLMLVFSETMVFSYENTTQMVAVCVQDKDMRASGTWGPRYSFRVPVAMRPRVCITRTEPDGTVTDMVPEPVTFIEENYRSGRSAKFTVSLSEKPTGTTATKNPVHVNLKLVKEGDGDAVLSQTNLLFYLTKTSADVYFHLLDGCGLYSDFKLIAEVSNVTSNRVGAWSDYYAGNIAYFNVKNADPVITSLGGDVFRDSAMTNYVTLGKSVAIEVSVTDIAADLSRVMSPTGERAFTVSWGVDSAKPTPIGPEDIEVDTTGSGVTNAITAKFTYTPKKERGSVVRVIVEDGDDGVAETMILFFVEPSKRLRVLPVGPVNRSSSQSKYAAMTGLGKGRVYSGDADRYEIDSFAHTYYSNIRESQLTVYAFGYPAATNAAGYADDGTLGDQNGETGKDYAISQSGSSLAANLALGNYVYGVTGKAFDDEWRYDNFFYCWFEAPSRDDDSAASLSEGVNGVMRPVTKPNVAVSVDAQFDAYEEDKQSYGVKRIEAIFSREFYPEDNMGDINADGIPDLYVRRYGFGVYDLETGEMAGSDVSALTTFNEDEDALPTTDTSVYGAFIPGLRDSWLDAEGGSGTGRPFTAKLEIRGFHDGLNDAPAQAGIADVVCDSTTNSFSALELSAARIAGALKADGNPDIEKWSPERPTDPTLEDTDGDGLPDGYEYYIWYQAHVGYMENGVHKFMTGRRYVPENPGEPEMITSDEIVSYYDPLVAHPGFARQTSDIDNDGIPDYLEFETGTNPFDFDTDGDGLPDGYEVMLAGEGANLDPLKAYTTGTVWDRDQNADGDAMAAATVKMSLACVTLADGTTGWYCAEAFAPTNTGLTVTGTVVSVTVDDKDRLYFTTVTIDADVEFLRNDLRRGSVWSVTEKDGAYILGEPADLRKGVAVEVVSDKAEVVKQTLSSTPVPAWKAWKYGIDNGFARGAELKKSADPLKGCTVHSVSEADILLLHFQIYQEYGFDPRTAWQVPPIPAGFKNVNTRNYTLYDEFLSMAFFHYEDTVTADVLQQTTSRTLQSVWKSYSTNPLSADGEDIDGDGNLDGDGMPDGWELYLMSGEKKYDDKGDRVIDYGPRAGYSPLVHIGKAPSDDSDSDGIDWPNEFSGIDSSAEYASTPSITCLDSGWRNKKWPTDPWNADTDGDGLSDGFENCIPPPGQWRPEFRYGTAGSAGGALNPLSWDTDGDGLPDPFEAQRGFSGTFTEGATSNIVSNVVGRIVHQTSVNGYCENVWRKAGITWKRDGLDGTVNDAREDYDGDGLANWQEYLVGAMRCWRYDDTTSTWGAHAFDAAEAEADWNGYWYKKLVDEQSEEYNPNLVSGMFDLGAYFSCCRNDWDPVKGRFYMFHDGVDHNLSNPPDKYKGPNGERYNVWTFKAANADWGFGLCPHSLVYPGNGPLYPAKYICCDPTNADTDHDGMDDRYELFHGMNPLLGASGFFDDGKSPCDIVYDAYYRGSDSGVNLDAEMNFWLNPVMPHRDYRVKDESKSMFDFSAFPWLNGLATADPDGDNLRNQQEAIMPGLQAASTYLHTDPTPLWMTDSSYSNSFTRLYYQAEATSLWMSDVQGTFSGPDGEEYSFADFPGFSYKNGVLSHSYKFNQFFLGSAWLFGFEENEGYDSDHDWESDFAEGQAAMSPASDPQRAESPLRRQAMWFNGTDAFLQTPLPLDETCAICYLQAEPHRNFLYYTVECWAMPDTAALAKDGLQTLVERVILTDTSNAADENFIRKNFLLGLKDGRWYTRFDTTGTDAKQYVEIDAGTSATNGWTHLAATYDGVELKLYVNGLCVNTKPTSLQPEHGLAAAAINGFGVLARGSLVYNTISILVGASAKTGNGIVFDSGWRTDGLLPTTLADYGNFYNGYIDEVRIWDGARSAAEILSDYENRVRYTAEHIGKNKRLIYSQWSEGATRAPGSPTLMSPEIKYHWSFDHLPGAVNPSDVAKVPAGFSTAAPVADSRAIWSRPEGWTNAWWHSVDVRSTVYTDTAWVPWIADTVGHLPRLDLTTVDSVYWSEDFAGYEPAVRHGLTGFSFPRTGEVWSRSVQQTYSDWGVVIEGSSYSIFLLPTRLRALYDAYAAETVSLESLFKAYRFTLRDRQLEGFDLLPMGGAFPRRLSSAEGGMWDDGSASDAWAQTGNDGDNNGLPDWWEDWARNNYCTDLPPSEVLDRDTIVDYHGQSLTAWEAYLRDLAAGMIKDGENVTFESDYAATVDTDGDGLPDWWEDATKTLDKTDPADAAGDADHDGLSAYQEYVLSGKLPKLPGIAALNLNIPILNPKRAFSAAGQTVPDYFLCYTNAPVNVTGADGKTHFSLNQYFGSIVTDHDMMEDWWENFYPNTYTSAMKYDPLDDRDEDGWSTWAECRASLWGGYFSADLIDRWTGAESEQYVPCRPEPVIGVRATYYGKRDVTGAQLVIRTSSGQTPRVDATFIVPNIYDAEIKYLGSFAGDVTMHGHLSPGMINPNAVVFERALVSAERTYFWNFDEHYERAAEENNEAVKAILDSLPRWGSLDLYRELALKWPLIALENSDFDWETFATTIAASDEMSATIIQTATDGDFGYLDCKTGEFSLDMSKFTGEKDVENYIFRVQYTSRSGNEWPRTVYVSNTKEFQAGESETSPGSGYVREGRNTIEAFFDLDGSGTYDPGEPYGFAPNVDVGWHRTGVTVIELSDTAHSVPRLNVVSATDDRSVIAGVTSGEASSGSGGETAKDATGLSKTVFIRRRSINGIEESESGGVVRRVPQRTLVTKEFVLDDRAYLTEADVLSNKKFDLDAKWLVRDATGFGISRADILEVAYDVVESVTLADGTQSNVVVKGFVNTFNASRGMATPLAPIDAAPVYSAVPTFTFSSDDRTMTAYRLQVRATGGETVYDSGIQLLPGRTGQTAGVSAWEVTPPLFADDIVTAGEKTGALFADGTAYEWRVALFNAKYAEIEEAEQAWSAWASFALDLANVGRNPETPTGYANAAVSVRYYGPSITNDLSGKVIVEAFASGDFRGQPLARVRLADTSSLDDLANVAAIDAVLRGIAPGQTFLRAYIDFNGNNRRDSWEAWGYANMVGKSMSAIYNPNPLKLTAQAKDFAVPETADVTIFIEDCDVNKNEIPDGLEPTVFPNEESEEEDSAGTWEEWSDVDLTIDADYAIEGDVMAYREEKGLLVVLWDGSDETDVGEHQYLYRGDAARLPVRGDSAAGLALARTYDYNGRYGLGAGVSPDVVASLKVYEAKEVVVALVHAQVYDAAGFNFRTAVAADDAVDTKPFTVMDKYLLARYLENTGRTPENPNPGKYESYFEYLMAAGTPELWAQYTLRSDQFDADRDGIADGWELYVMAGPSGAASCQTGLSPWTFADRDDDLDGDGLPNVREYDSGHLPTNPWATDTHGDGLGDKAAHDYFFKYGDTSTEGEGYRADYDNDQLSNLIEYMISTADGFETLDAAKMSTFDKVAGQLVPDYFLRHGSLYLGEMFTDHDMMEDWWEDDQPTDVMIGGVRVPNLSRYRYDAHLDPDDDGWSNWEELRASQAMGTTNIVTVLTNEVDGTVSTNVTEMSLYDALGGRPMPLVNINVRYNGIRSNMGTADKNYVVVIKAWSQENANDPMMSGAPDAAWKFPVANQHAINLDAILLGAGDYGYLRSGKNMFIAYVAEDNGEETAVPPFAVDMPYGVVTDVEVSYLGADAFSIEMTDVNSTMMRVDLRSALAEQLELPAKLDEVRNSDDWENEEDILTETRRVCAKAVGAHVDRGIWSVNYPSVGLFYEMAYIGTNVAVYAANSNAVTVRILRSLVNGKSKAGDCLVERRLDLATHPVLTEADLMADLLKQGVYDLDWGSEDFNRAVTSATYRVVVGTGTIDNYQFNENLAVAFENRFEYGPTQTVTSNRTVTVTEGQPTFSWTHANTIGKLYPAFRLQIWKKGTTDVVYDSGIRPTPARDSTGVYRWTAPIWPGLMTADGVIFEAETDYDWTVSMLDAKFTKMSTAVRDPRSTLRVTDSSSSSALSDYGQIAVAVKYMGPGDVSTTTLANMIRVEAYSTIDFSGKPCALSYVKHLETLASPSNHTLNAILSGLPKGGAYYIRAFLDTDGDGEHDDWESWGYGNYVGTDRRDVYTPRAYAVSVEPADDLKTPTAVVYLEDTDINGNKLPDVWEWNKDGSLSGGAADGIIANSPYIVTLDEKGALATNIFYLVEKGGVELPYYAALTEMKDGGSLSSVSLALALAGIDLTNVETTPAVTITSFSLTDGITLDVDARATIDGETLVPEVVKVAVKLTLTLQGTSVLGGEWQDLCTEDLVVDVNAGSQMIDAASLQSFNDKVKANAGGTAGFFRVKVAVAVQ